MSQDIITTVYESLSKDLKETMQSIFNLRFGWLYPKNFDWEKIKQRLDAIPALSKEAMKLAASQGWFFGWYDSLEDLVLLVEKLATIDISELDEIMMQHHAKRLDYVEERLIERYSERTKPLQAAFNTHKNLGAEGYYLSIPIFISQADGILAEITKVDKPLHKEKKGQEKITQGAKIIKQKVETNGKVFDLLYPFFILHNLDFLKSEAERKKNTEISGKNFTALNRHQVLHGENSNYGSEINSLKAISFLAFVGLHLPDILKHYEIII